MKLDQMNWSASKKQLARKETIILPYQKHFDVSIPTDKQYWTMCGQCSAEDGSPLKGCELDQMLESGLIEEYQFRGVEINKDIHEANVLAYPKVSFTNGDFLRAMVKANHEGTFNSAIVNADLIQTPETGSLFVAKILDFLTENAQEMMFVANFITEMRHYSLKTGDYIMESLNKQPLFRKSMGSGVWKFEQQYYPYRGSGGDYRQTSMGTLLFFRGYHLTSTNQ